jgi:hypothetical protein
VAKKPIVGKKGANFKITFLNKIIPLTHFFKFELSYLKDGISKAEFLVEIPQKIIWQRKDFFLVLGP